MPPWQCGGNMIRDVTFERTLYQPAPVRFEAGTTSIADAVGLGAALDYVLPIGRENISRHERSSPLWSSSPHAASRRREATIGTGATAQADERRHGPLDMRRRGCQVASAM
jgi:Aminotransferase class-V